MRRHHSNFAALVRYSTVIDVLRLVKHWFVFLACCLSLFTLTLWTKHLVKLYEFMFSVLLVFVSFHCNQQTSNNMATTTVFPVRALLKWDLESVFQTLPGLFFIFCNIAIQSILASGYLIVNFGPSVPILQGALALCFLIPSLTVMLPFDTNPLPHWCFYLLALHVAVVVCYNFSSVRIILHSHPFYSYY